MTKDHSEAPERIFSGGGEQEMQFWLPTSQGQFEGK